MVLAKCLIAVLLMSGLAAATSYDELSYLCSTPGVMAHPEDCTQVLSCKGTSDLGYYAETFWCPPGQAFSDKEKACVNIEMVPGCKANPEQLESHEIHEIHESLWSGGQDWQDAADECNGQAVHCANCSTLVFCRLINGEYGDPQTVDCSANKQYCDKDAKSCTDSLPSGCPLPGFVCTGPGYYPDPNNCSIYHICYGDDEYESHRCLPKYVYNSKKFLCVPKLAPEDCVTVKCPHNFIGLIPYPKDPKYYIFCLPEDKSEIFLCPGNLEFVESVHECKFVCRAEGQFVNIEDCTKYHVCTATATPGVFIQTEETCPPGLGFNAVTKTCDLISNVKCPPI